MTVPVPDDDQIVGRIINKRDADKKIQELTNTVNALDLTVQEVKQDMKELKDSLKDILDIFGDMKGTVNLFYRIGNFIKWIAPIIIVISGLYAAIFHKDLLEIIRPAKVLVK